MTEILKISGWLLFSGVKFLFAPGSIYIIGGYSYWETIFISVSGGWLGVLAFYYFGKIIFKFWDWIINRFKTRIPEPKKRFTKTNRVLIRLKNHRMGLVALALISPSIISIPVGCLLAAKYFWYEKKTVPIFFAAVVFWAFVLTTLVHHFKIHI